MICELALSVVLLGCPDNVMLDEAVPELVEYVNPAEPEHEPVEFDVTPANMTIDEFIEENEPEPEVHSHQVASTQRSVWDRLADCESGNWINGGQSFETGSARWGWGGSDPIPPWGDSQFDGGLQFHPDTWTWLAPEGYPARAYDASREQQIVVAEQVLERQGWAAWPVCSRKVGLR